MSIHICSFPTVWSNNELGFQCHFQLILPEQECTAICHFLGSQGGSGIKPIVYQNTEMPYMM